MLDRLRALWWRFRGKELCCGHEFAEHWSNDVCSLCDCTPEPPMEV